MVFRMKIKIDKEWIATSDELDENEEWAIPMEPLQEHDRRYRVRLYRQSLDPASEALMLVPKISP
jgi:hypothetical protein